MKKTPILLLAFCCLLFSETTFAATSFNSSSFIEKKINGLDPVQPVYFSINEFLQLTPKEYEKITGKKMSLFQKIAFRLKQQKVKRLLKKDEAGVLSDFEATGFVLGLFMSVVGIGISYLIDYKDTKKWAWRGAAIGGIFILIALLL